MRCHHCGQHVEDYDEHILKCLGIRAALDDTYWPGWLRGPGCPPPRYASTPTNARSDTWPHIA
jgi:hypothetical protein